MNEQQLDAVKQALYGLVMLVNIEKAKPWQVELFDKTVDNLLSIISQDALDKKAENARELGLSYDDEPKIGCVNHDCDQCKAVQSAERGEPAAYVVWGENNVPTLTFSKPADTHVFDALYYTTPPSVATPLAAQKPWVGLTDAQILAANYPDGEENEATIAAPDVELIGFARAIEAKLKAKNERKEKNT